MYQEFEIDFERTVTRFLGDEATNIASLALDKDARKSWYTKVLKRILAEVNLLDTTTRHKESLLSCIEGALNVVGKNYNEEKLFFYILRLSGALLGFANNRGSVLYTPIYSQTHSQYYTESILAGGDVLQDYEDKNNSLSIRRDLVFSLSAQGLSTFTIAQVLNISEYQVKKLKKRL